MCLSYRSWPAVDCCFRSYVPTWCSPQKRKIRNHKGSWPSAFGSSLWPSSLCESRHPSSPAVWTARTTQHLCAPPQRGITSSAKERMMVVMLLLLEISMPTQFTFIPSIQSLHRNPSFSHCRLNLLGDANSRLNLLKSNTETRGWLAVF